MFEGTRFDHDICTAPCGRSRANPRIEEHEDDARAIESVYGGTPDDREPRSSGEDEQLAAVVGLLAGFGISGLPVVDSGDHLVGVVSQADLVRLSGSTLPWTGWHVAS
jgi:hypothetical protein